MSELRPLVSVVTANYNGAAHLAPAIRSVLDQSLSDLELIIVDDASTDDSLAIAEAEAARDPRVRLLVQPANAGPAAARNRALDQARGQWIAIFDGDDLMAPDRLASLVARAAGEGADIVVDNLMVFTDGSDEPWRPFLGGREFAAPRDIGLADYVGAARMYARRPGLGYLKPLIRADALRDVRYREALRIGEDYDLIVRLLVAGRTLRFEPRALYRYRKRESSISHRIRREHLEQMLAADAELAPALARQPPPVRRAQAARRRSLRAALAYDRVITSLQAHRFGVALAAALAAPAAWPLLTMPVEARLRRLAARRGASTGRVAGPAAA